ncbi:MAG: FapA family protein [bacterium]
MEDFGGYFNIDPQREGVFLSVYPPMGKGEAVDPDNVMIQLDLAGLTGIDFEAVKKAVAEAAGQPVKIGEGVEKEAARRVGNYVTVDISKDEMAGFITINQPKTGRLPRLEVEEIKNFLLRNGIVYGIDEGAIVKALSEGIIGKPVKVAQGIPPVSGQEGGINFKFKKDKTVRVAQADEGGKVNYRELGLIENVAPGRVLATRIPATRGMPGKTVRGKETPAKDGKEIPLPAGKNTRLSEDGLELRANVAGNAVWTGTNIAVETTYEVKGDVDMHVGNIDFVGDVAVSGSVREGFTVKAGGNIDVGGVVERATLHAGKDIRIQRGIVGQGEGTTYAGGNITAKFIEGGEVEAGGDVVISEDIMHSKIDAGGAVFCLSGRRGRIMGGRIRAAAQVVAKCIGSWVEVPTVVESGIDPRLRQELIDLEEKLEKERHEFHQLKLTIKTINGQKKAGNLSLEKEEMLIQYLKTQNELMASLRKTATKISALKEKLASLKGGRVSVAEILYPGVKLRIKNIPAEVTKEYRYCTIVEREGKISFRVYEEISKKKKKP